MMETTQQTCAECGTPLAGEKTCRDDFDQILFWEAEFPALGAVHHLTVLCYHLQHPSLYSPDGLAYAQQLLVEFVERGVSPVEIRRRSRVQVDSGNRSWKIKGTADAYGLYARPVEWTMTAADVVAGGSERYCDNVRVWARSVLDNLRQSGNLAAP
jgi:hypothetical protein